MQASYQAEITSYFQHQDYSLGVRRLLDYCLDLNNKDLLSEAINISKEFNLQKNEAGTSFTQVQTKAEQLLQKTSLLAIEPSQPKPLISVAGAGKTYSGGNFTLQPVSLQISSGDIYGIVGENGNGKTSLLNCLAGQLSLDKGIIHYHFLSNPDFYTIKHHIAFIPQRIPRWYGLLKDNLHFSASISGTYGKENELMVDFMLERLNLTKYAHLNWNQISSGYRTRFEIARVLLQKPKLLILDEPLANLDINAQQTILTDLRFMTKSATNSMGILLSSQQLHEVEKVADSVLFIKQGLVVHQQKKQSSSGTASHVLEVETISGREELLATLGEHVQLSYNGGFYTITSSQFSSQEMISKLISNQIPVTYFRDITHSTKRFF
jgi:ABC-2 type transport system ATP-binding protein